MDRIFDKNEIKYICTSIKKILKENKTHMKKMKNEANKAKQAYDSVPEYVKEARILQEANNLIKAIEEVDFDTFFKKLEDLETRACTNIPARDKKYETDTNQLRKEVDNLTRAVKNMQEFFRNTPLNIPPESFGQRLEVASLTWNEILEDTQVALNKLLMNIKGEDTKRVWYSVDPVNLSTGNFIYHRTDLEITGGDPLIFRRFYNAINHQKGVLGKDWNHNYELYLKTDHKEKILMLEDGREERFLLTSTGEYASVYQDSGVFKQTESGYEYITREQKKYTFDPQGFCICIETLHGGKILLSYAADLADLTDEPLETHEKKHIKYLHKIEKQTGEFFELSYDNKGCLHKVTDHTGRNITYKMSGDLLAGVSTPTGGWYHYLYTPQGKLEGVQNPEGVHIVENTFDEQMRTTKQLFPDGVSMQYSYHDEKRECVLTERNGSTVTYVHDDKFRDIKHIYSDGEESYAYNYRNQRTEFTDKLGNKTKYEYDEKGNRTSIITPLGNRMDLEYTEENRLKRVSIDGRQKLQNVYDEIGNLIKTSDAEENTYRFIYQDSALVEQIIQPDEGIVKLERDRRGNITCLTDPNGIKIYFKYNELNQVVETIDGNQNKTSYKYDLNGNIIQVTNPNGDSRKYTYNANDKVIKIQDFDGGITLREYNALNRPSKVIDKMGRTTLLTYDSMWNLARVTQTDGSKTTFIYNEHNRLTRIRNANGDVVRYTYDAVGNRIGVTDELGHKTTCSYDAMGRLKEVRTPDGGSTKYEYNAEGQVTRVQDALDNEVTLLYDGNGNLIKETNPLGESRHYTYTCMGQRASVTDEAGQTTSYTYDKAGKLIQITYPEGTHSSYTYDGNGNIKTYTNPKGHKMVYTYDALDQVIQIEGSSGERKSYTYDSMGNVTTMTDGRGAITNYEYSLSGKVIKTTDPLGNITTYQYDDRDRLLEICQHGEAVDREIPDTDLEHVNNRNKEYKRITRYEHDMLGRLTKVTNAMGHTETYEYDKKGQLLSRVDQEGYLTRYGYTPSGEVNHIQYADGREVRMSYNPIRQLQEIKDWLGSTRIAQDAMGRVKQVTYPDGKRVAYTYGSRGERTQITYPDGKELTYEYDSYTRLSSLNQGEETINYSYNNSGLLTKKSFPNGMETEYEYDNKGQLMTLLHKDSQGILDAYHYEYDKTGNRVSLTKNRRGLEAESGTYHYGYDLVGRLTDVTKDGEQKSLYTYDSFGNRTAMIADGIQTKYEYNSLNQLISKRDNQSDITYIYDKRGNLSQITENEKIRYRYTYGSINRMEECVNPEGQMIRYRYDGQGNRIGKTMEAGNGLFDKENPYADLPANEINYRIDFTRGYNNLLQVTGEQNIQTYYWDMGVIAMHDSKGLGEPDNSNYYLLDELSSPIRLFNSDGEINESYGYNEFGGSLYHVNEQSQPFGYTGYQYDKESDSYFANARHYQPDAGRFLSQDIFSGRITAPMTMNRYSYCYNNPIALVDRDGMLPALSKINDAIGDTLSDWGDAFAAGVDYVAEAISELIGQICSQVVEWGNENPEIKDAIAGTVKIPMRAAFNYSLPAVVFTCATKQGYMDGVLEKFDFHRDKAGIFHTSPDCWQQYLGYNDLYDWGFDIGTSMKGKKYPVVTANGEEYCIWMWKGDYVNLGAGAETGIYKGGEPHWDVAAGDALPMMISLYDKDGNTIFVYDPEDLQWWITGFDPMIQNINAEELEVIGSIDFSAYPELWKAYCDKFQGYKEWCFDTENKKAYYKW